MMKVTYTYDHYYVYSEITEILQQYAREYPQYCRLSAIGTTSEGRSIWMLELTDLACGDFADKPGFALDGNVHAGEVTGSMCCMYFLDYLLTNRTEKEVAWLLAHYTVYCVPRISPDGSEAYLTTPVMLRSVNKLFPYDEPQPGIQPDDIDGDGVIRQMRIRNVNGAFKKWDKDPRIMVKRRPDEVSGEFYDVFSEGTVCGEEDCELQPAPDKFGNDFNRNFPAWWGVGGRGGAYGLSNPETRAFADFLHAHANICTCLNFHTSGGVYLYPPAFEARSKAAKEDMERYREIGKICKAETGYDFVNLHDEFLGPMIAPVGGSIDDFCHYVLGIAACTCECWDLDTRCGFPHEYPRVKPPADEEQTKLLAAKLQWLEENNDGKGFADWKEVSHPQLGTVEVGGFDVKHVIQNPPEQFLLQEAEKHTCFMLREMKLLPRLEITQLQAVPLGDCYEITAKLANRSFLPTYVTAEAKEIGLAKPVTVKIEGAQVTVGKAEEEIGHLSGFAGAGDYGWGLGGITVNHAPAEKTLRYVVRGQSKSTVTVTCESPRAGKVQASVVLP